MSKKRYPHDREPAHEQPSVKEAKARAYRQGKNQQVGLSLAAVKKRLKKPVKRSKGEIDWALEIAGIGEGPADLSRNMREYLYSNR